MTRKPNRPTLPRYIALCGNPKAGKTEVQNILCEHHRVLAVDDGHPLRAIAVEHFGLTWPQVGTQSGKLESVEIAGRAWEVRKVLGEIGNALEDKFGKDVLPWMAITRAERQYRDVEAFSFGSVRRDQGKIYQAAGGIVIEIRNPLSPPSENEFDTYDTSIVDYVIENDALARGWSPEHARLDLGHKIWSVLVDHDMSGRNRQVVS